MILVTGATGKTGAETVRLLQQRGSAVRALVRDRTKAEAMLGSGVDLAVGDLDQPETLTPALRGVEKLFLCSSPDTRMADLQHNALVAAREAGVRHVVKISAIGVSPGSKFSLGRQHARTEREMKDSGMAWTILQPTFFMQNFLGHAGSIAAEGKMYAPAADGRAALVDARDIAEVAAAALAESGHESQTYVVTGSDSLSHSEVAARIGAAIGKPVAYVQVPADAAKQAMMQGGMPEWYADDMVVLMEIFGSGVVARTTDVVPRVVKRPARTFDAFAREFSGRFAGAASGHATARTLPPQR
jgi:uncharacterized protein YbjT (DUF2867 family)